MTKWHDNHRTIDDSLDFNGLPEESRNSHQTKVADRTKEIGSEKAQASCGGRVAFKHAVGTAIGAVAVGTLVAGIGLYRRKPLIQTLQAFAGGSLIGAISFVGVGDDIYDKAAKDLRGIASILARPKSNRSPDRQR